MDGAISGGETAPREDESFAAVAEYAPVMLWRGDAAGKCVYLNRAQREFWGVDLADIGEFSWATTLLPEDAEKVYGPFAEGMSKRVPFKCEARYRRSDGAIRILETSAEPRFDASGAFTGMIGVNSDVTDERRAKAELSESEARMRALADNLPYGMIYQLIAEADGRIYFSFVSSRCETLNGVRAEVAQSDPATLYNLIVPEDRPIFETAEREAREAFRGFDCETRMRRADGEVRWFRMSSAPRHGENGAVIWDGVQVDIHDRKLAEERQALLMKELNHRIKNTITTVVSIAAQTGRTKPTIEAFNTAFHARLIALAKTHDLLTAESWDSAALRDILQLELRPYFANTDTSARLSLDGAPVRIAARAAVTLALVIHELATNAAKYGALSTGGSLEISWTVDERAPGAMVTLSWRERGGPKVPADPVSGFGSKLIQRLLATDLGGSFEARFASEGFEAELTFLASGVAG
ncbi:MAG: PAS domain-containing protein [Terricaulis sp.]